MSALLLATPLFSLPASALPVRVLLGLHIARPAALGLNIA